MSELPTAQKNRLESWANRAISSGWLPDDATQVLGSATPATPGQLFDQTARPLVAGLFGGTGVGKSTLLNRLAGERIALASAERPTSRDITVYVHSSISVDRLPDELPLQRMRTARHDNEAYRQVMFVDMPDFDSVEQANRELVDLWLPHLDVVMYVVSPERYRDDQGWRLLQRHAGEHAWLFIINQWDRGNAAQRGDFIAQLQAQGLNDPLVFCTDSADPGHQPGADTTLATDDLPALQDTLLSLSDERVVKALETHGVLARLQSLKSLSDAWIAPLANNPALDNLDVSWGEHAHQLQDSILPALDWPVAQVAHGYTDTTPFWKRLLGGKQAGGLTDTSLINTLTRSLNERLDTGLDTFINQQAYEHALPASAMIQAMGEPHQRALQQNQTELENALNQSISSPGRRWHRRLSALVGSGRLVLPVLALIWISYRVISAFVAGGTNSDAYLNINFMTNGIMLLGISWLLPAVLYAMLTPSREKAALNGLNRGIEQVLEQMQSRGDASIRALQNQAQQLATEYRQLWTELPGDDGTILPESVRRLLSMPVDQPVVRALDVRANTHNSTDAAPLS